MPGTQDHGVTRRRRPQSGRKWVSSPESMLAFIEKQQDQPSNGDLMAEIKRVGNRVTTITDTVQAIKTTGNQIKVQTQAKSSLDSYSAAALRGAQQWALQAGGPTRSPNSAATTPSSAPLPSTTDESHKGGLFYITVKETGIQDELYRLKEKEGGGHLLKRVQRAIAGSGDAQINKIKIPAVKLTTRKDLEIYTYSDEDALALMDAHSGWGQACAGKESEIREARFRFVVHFVHRASMDILRDKEGVLQRANSENFNWNRGVRFIDVTPLDAKSWASCKMGSVIFDVPHWEDVNDVIKNGFLHKGEKKRVTKYDKSLGIEQCLKCYDYGHQGIHCPNKLTCGYCADPHDTRGCEANRANDRTKACCRNCGKTSKHTAFDAACPKRQEQRKVTQVRRQLTYPYLLKPAYTVRSRESTIGATSTQGTNPMEIATPKSNRVQTYFS
jgi:hypothetical protein